MLCSCATIYRRDTAAFTIGVAKGYTGCTFTPRADKKFSGLNLQGKVVSASPGRDCTPEAEQECIFLGNWGDVDGGRGYLGSFSVCFEGDD